MSDKQGSIEHYEQPGKSLTTVTLTAEQFETLYLQPRNAAHGTLTSTFGNPTPLGMSAFLLAFLPLSLDLLGFQGATSASATVMTGVFYGVCGIGLYIACIMEWIVGNTFPMVVFGTFGGFWISYGVILQPTVQIAASFAPPGLSGSAAAAAGAQTPQFNSGIALYLVAWLVLGIMFFFASLRTNLPFAVVFMCLDCLVGCLIAGFIHLGQGSLSRASMEFKAAGAFGLAGSIAGWYVNLGLILASTGYPFTLPMFDLSGKVLVGRKQDAAAKAA